jgi:EAL domain-containing protein (putative c-di-GMP-specific phosphodiesterase class I)
VTLPTTRSFAVGSLFSPEQVRAIHLAVDTFDVGIAFQPIVDLRLRRVYAFEALARPKSRLFASPVEMFDVAVQAGRIAELGRHHRQIAVQRCPGYRLFLNVNANEFDYGWLVRPDDPIFHHRWHVTLEITESVPIKYFSQCHSVLAEIRKKGVELAIDDFGAGFSNVKYIADLRPEIVKFDRELIAGVAPATDQARLLDSLVRLCHEMGAKVIAEGIETKVELDTVIALGVDYGQGYLLARPADPPPEMIWPGTRR